MKTEARCPTCGFPFSFWNVAFARSPFTIYCKSCGWRIVITAGKSIMWAAIAVLTLMSFVLFQFIVAQNLPRLALLVALWLVCFYIVEIIAALMIVNWAQFSKPEQADGADESHKSSQPRNQR